MLSAKPNRTKFYRAVGEDFDELAKEVFMIASSLMIVLNHSSEHVIIFLSK